MKSRTGQHITRTATMLAVGITAFAAPAWAEHWALGDLNRDGRVDFNDINPFVECLIQGGCGFISPPMQWTVHGPQNVSHIGYMTVIKDDGVYKLWADNPQLNEIVYAESPNGSDWGSLEPVYHPQCTNDDRPKVVRKAGLLHLWTGAQCIPQSRGVDHATSTNGRTWTFQECTQNWCAYTILPTDAGFVCWYLPRNDWNKCYRHATSEDGTVWTDHGCVMEPGAPGSFDAELGTLCVIRQYGYYHMWYTCLPEPGGRTRFAYASSPNGITWTKHGLLSGFEALPDRELGCPSVIFDAGVLRMWFYLEQTLYYAESTGCD